VLQEQKRIAPKSEWPEIEARLREAQRNLEELERVRPDAAARLREVQQSLELHARRLQEYYQQNPEQGQKRIEELRATLAQLEKDRPANEARMKEAREKIAEMEKLYTPERGREVEKTIAEMQKVEGDRKARVIYRVEPEYTLDAREKKIEGTVVLTLTIDHDGLPQNIQVKKSLYPSLDQSAIEAARKMRFEPAIKNGQPVSMFISAEFNFAIESHSKQELEETEKRIAEARATQGESAGREMKMRREQTEQQGRAERARDLTRGAVLSMDRAIQIATSQVPGKVLSCSLGRDGEKIFYHVVIIGGDGDKSTTTYVWVSAIDGQIFKTEKEEQRKEEAATESAPRARISGGVLNSKAVSLPQPEFPAIARSSYPSMTPRMSSSRRIRCSSPSSLISLPVYLPKRTRSPFLTSGGTTLPSSRRPGPTAVTRPSWGFSLAVSGMMIPPVLRSSRSSIRFTITRSNSGRTRVAIP